jgi:rare lipoprotein A
MKKRIYIAILAVWCAGQVACSVMPKGVADLDVGMKERGIASWYGDDFHGWVTASGEIYDMHALTGAHRTLPLGTVVRVTNVINGRHVAVRINDRGPYVSGRILDLSYAAATKLGMVNDGVAAIHLAVMGHEPFAAMLTERTDAGLPATREEWVYAVHGHSAVPTTAHADRSQRTIPSDMLRERRNRRVAEILAADRRVDLVALHLS